MFSLSYFVQKSNPVSTSTLLSRKLHNSRNTFYNSINFEASASLVKNRRRRRTSPYYTRISSRRAFIEEEEEDDENGCCSFEEAVQLFNRGEYYSCHDVLETLWNKSIEPSRTLMHGILQCAVGFHHLFNQNHRGAMMELGEGVCKLRKLNFKSGPFHQFEEEVAAVLDFIYKTQLEHAACTDELCLTLDQSERSYQLLGGFGAGQALYRLDNEQDGCSFIVFCPDIVRGRNESQRIKLPLLQASEEHLSTLDHI